MEIFKPRGFVQRERNWNAEDLGTTKRTPTETPFGPNGGVDMPNPNLYRFKMSGNVLYTGENGMGLKRQPARVPRLDKGDKEGY